VLARSQTGGLSQCAGCSQNAHRFTGHERGLRKIKTSTMDKESSPRSMFMLYFTPVIPLLGKRPVLVRSQTGNFYNMQHGHLFTVHGDKNQV
jgi:hypothetical protein